MNNTAKKSQREKPVSELGKNTWASFVIYVSGFNIFKSEFPYMKDPDMKR